MSTRKISDFEEFYWSKKFSSKKRCLDKDHFPCVSKISSPGVYRHVCPSCRKTIIFSVPETLCTYIETD